MGGPYLSKLHNIVHVFAAWKIEAGVGRGDFYSTAIVNERVRERKALQDRLKTCRLNFPLY